MGPKVRGGRGGGEGEQGRGPEPGKRGGSKVGRRVRGRRMGAEGCCPKLRKGGGPEGWGPEGWGAQNFAFFPSPALIFVLFLSFSGVFSWNFGGVLKRRDPPMCTFGVLGLSCDHDKTPREREKKNENEG